MGLAVGFAVRFMVAFLVGFAVGLAVGFAVGFRVGFPVKTGDSPGAVHCDRRVRSLYTTLLRLLHYTDTRMCKQRVNRWAMEGEMLHLTWLPQYRSRLRAVLQHLILCARGDPRPVPSPTGKLHKHKQSSDVEKYMGTKSMLEVTVALPDGTQAMFINVHTTAGGRVDPESPDSDGIRQSEIDEMLVGPPQNTHRHRAHRTHSTQARPCRPLSPCFPAL